MPTGPRKYKRRRSKPDDFLIDSNTSASVKKEIEEELATFTFRKSVPKVIELDNEDFRLPEQILTDVSDGAFPLLQNQSKVQKSTKKAKMIHTKRTQVTAAAGGGTISKQKVSTDIEPKLFTVEDSLGYDVIVPATNIKSESFPLLDDGKPLAETIEYNETQNSFLLDIVNKTNYSDKFDSDIVNDLKEILQSPVKRPTTTPNAAGTGRPRRSIKPTFKVVESRQQVKEVSKRGNITVTRMKIDTSTKDERNSNVCQICENSFKSRNDLMAHVQMHI